MSRFPSIKSERAPTSAEPTAPPPLPTGPSSARPVARQGKKAVSGYLARRLKEEHAVVQGLIGSTSPARRLPSARPWCSCSAVTTATFLAALLGLHARGVTSPASAASPHEACRCRRPRRRTYRRRSTPIPTRPLQDASRAVNVRKLERADVRSWRGSVGGAAGLRLEIVRINVHMCGRRSLWTYSAIPRRAPS